MVSQHLAQKQRPEVSLQLSPVVLDGTIVLRLVHYVPYRNYVELYHLLLTGLVNRAIINKEINSLILISISYLTQKALKLLFREAVLFNGERE